MISKASVLFNFILLFYFCIFTAFCGFAQELVKPGALGFQFVINKFNSNTPQLSKGIGMNYVKGIKKNIDISTSVSGSFINYKKKGNIASDEKHLLLEAEGSINAKLLSDKKLITPYASTGAGLSKHPNSYSFFLPVGAGLQFNFSNTAFLFLNIQRRIQFTDASMSHYFFSVGLLGNIGNKKSKKSVLYSVASPSVKHSTDKDGDGIYDSIYACIDVYGLKEFNGCPDTDNDGIPDSKDQCPKLPGVAKYNGCPIPDSDQDGLNDVDDKCPIVSGLIKYKGCPIPDSDKDGINDEVDRCIDEFGLPTNYGCPLKKEEVQKAINSAATKIFFATRSDKLLTESFKSLDEIVRILKQYPDITVNLEGHTDDVGTRLFNQKLSEERALTIMKYLIANHVSSDRLKASGYGEDRPVHSNESEVGRSNNRRVEIIVSFN